MSSRMTIHKNHNMRCSSRVESKNGGMSETIALENLSDRTTCPINFLGT